MCKGYDVAIDFDILEKVVEVSTKIHAICARLKRNEKVNPAALGNIVLDKHTPNMQFGKKRFYCKAFGKLG